MLYTSHNFYCCIYGTTDASDSWQRKSCSVKTDSNFCTALLQIVRIKQVEVSKSWWWIQLFTGDDFPFRVLWVFLPWPITKLLRALVLCLLNCDHNVLIWMVITVYHDTLCFSELGSHQSWESCSVLVNVCHLPSKDHVQTTTVTKRMWMPTLLPLSGFKPKWQLQRRV